MSIVKTEIVVVNQDTPYSIPGDWTPQQIITNYASQIPGIGNMNYSERTEVRAEGTVKIITFTPRTGNKGYRRR